MYVNIINFKTSEPTIMENMIPKYGKNDTEKQ